MFEQLSHSRSILRHDDLRRDLVERNEDECALGQAGMRNFKIGLTELKVSDHQDIQIEGARAVADTCGAITAELTFNIEQRFQ